MSTIPTLNERLGNFDDEYYKTGTKKSFLTLKPPKVKAKQP